MSGEPRGGAAGVSAEVRAGTRERLLARAMADARHRGLRSRARTRFIAPLAVGAALAASLLLMLAQRDRNALQLRLTSQEALVRALTDSVQLVSARRDSLLLAMTGPSVRVMSLTAATARSTNAFMFWDIGRSRWTFVAHGLPPLPPGRAYQLWLVTATERISVGTLPVSVSGSAFVQATYALPAGALRAVAVTEEPAGGSPQPTSTPIIAAVAGS